MIATQAGPGTCLVLPEYYYLLVKVVVGFDAILQIHSFTRSEHSGRFQNSLLFMVIDVFVVTAQVRVVENFASRCRCPVQFNRLATASHRTPG